MIDDLVNYVMKKANSYYADDFPIDDIEVWIRAFFNDLFQKKESKYE